MSSVYINNPLQSWHWNLFSSQERSPPSPMHKLLLNVKHWQGNCFSFFLYTSKSHETVSRKSSSLWNSIIIQGRTLSTEKARGKQGSEDGEKLAASARRRKREPFMNVHRTWWSGTEKRPFPYSNIFYPTFTFICRILLEMDTFLCAFQLSLQLIPHLASYHRGRCTGRHCLLNFAPVAQSKHKAGHQTWNWVSSRFAVLGM